MEYYFTKIIDTSFEEAEKRTIEELKKEGFGIITEIDMQAKLKEKLDKSIGKYKILGACNPPYAYKALQVEERIGVMLPCNVVINAIDNHRTEVVAVNPVASMMAVNNPHLEPLALEITEKIRKVIESL